MGRQRNDPIVFQSSIAMLQERFKQLQRVKEKREERELHRMLVEPKLLINLNLNPTTTTTTTNMHYYYYDYEPSKLFVHFLPPKSSPPSSSPTTTTTTTVSSLSLWSNSHSSSNLNDDFQCFQPMIETTSSMHVSANKLEDSYYDHEDDVDTSLHL